MKKKITVLPLCALRSTSGAAAENFSTHENERWNGRIEIEAYSLYNAPKELRL